jgi:hypothetical protein
MIASRSEDASSDARQFSPAAAAVATAEARVAQAAASARGIPPSARVCPPEPPQPATARAASAVTETILNTVLPLPAMGFGVASHFWSETVKVLLMPMLHGCAFPGCSTFTLSTYCVEHELLARALKESERSQATSLAERVAEHVADAALTADPAGEAQEAAPL